MAKKVFTSKFFTDLFYEVLDEYWLDDNTYVMVFQDMVDADGDTYHLEVEYHKDEDRVTFVRVYEHENVDASHMITHVFKTQIEEYILKQVGVVSKDGMLVKRNINVELTLDVPKNMSIGEFQEWLSIAYVEVNRLVATKNEKLANKVKILAIENKGVINK